MARVSPYIILTRASSTHASSSSPSSHASSSSSSYVTLSTSPSLSSPFAPCILAVLSSSRARWFFSPSGASHRATFPRPWRCLATAACVSFSICRRRLGSSPYMVRVWFEYIYSAISVLGMSAYCAARALRKVWAGTRDCTCATPACEMGSAPRRTTPSPFQFKAVQGYMVQVLSISRRLRAE